MSNTPELCSVCNLPVHGSSRIRSNGRVFHEDCFVCDNCKIALDSCFFKNGKLYCDACETELFAKKCDKCKLPIQTTVVTARGRSFHSECFTCACCQSILKSNFFYISGQFVCDDCDSKGLQPPPITSSPTTSPPVQPVKPTQPVQSPVQVHSVPTVTTPPPSSINIVSGSITPFTSTTTIDQRTNVEIPGANIVLSQVPSNSTNVIYVVGGNSGQLPQFSDSPKVSPPHTPPYTPPQTPPNGYQQPQHQYAPQNFLQSPQSQPMQRVTGDFLPNHHQQQPYYQQPQQQYQNNQPTYQHPPYQTQPQIQRNTGDFIQQQQQQNSQQHLQPQFNHLSPHLQQRNTGDHFYHQQQQQHQQQLQQQNIQPQRNTGDFIKVPSSNISNSSNGSSPITSANTSSSSSPITPNRLPTQQISTLKLSHDPFTEKFIPKIQGKTLQELLKYNTFDEILNDVIKSGAHIHNHIPKDEVEFGEVMAAGASGKVHRGKWRGRDVAIKVYSADNICFSREEFDREVNIMTLLDNENFATFYGANCESPKYLFHLTELVKCGSLRDNLLNKQVQLSYAQQVTIALDIAGAMKYLHSLGVIHRDLKSGNVLLTDDNRGKVIDFGTSRAIDLSKQMTLNLGTSCWMAPEVFRNQPYTESCDVYSFGIVLWEIFCRKDPYDGVNSWSIPIMVTKGERPAIPADCPSEYAKLIKACWEDKPKKRPKFKEINQTLMKILGSLTLGKKKGSSFFGK